MKNKFIILGVMMLALITILTINVSAYSIDSAEIVITPSKTECNAGDTVDFTVSLKNLNASDGLVGLGAYVEYDSNLLTLNTNAQGLSGWDNASIFSETKRFATTRNGHSENNEDILKITFTAKEVSADTKTAVSLSSLELSNGSELDIEKVTSSEVTIKPAGATPTPPPAGDTNTVTPPSGDTNTVNPPSGETNTVTPPSSGNTTGNTTNNTSKLPGNTAVNTSRNTTRNTTKNTSSPVKNTTDGGSETDSNIPNLGAKGYLGIVIGVAVVITVLLYIKMKRLDKKIEKESKVFKDEDENNDNKNQ